MKLFVWTYVDDLTDSYHNGGGLAIIEESLEKARESIGRSEALNKEPDITRDCEGPAHVFVFPDAGCC